MNKFWNDIKEALINLLHTFGWAWWVEIATQSPRCTYFFGPFLSAKEAKTASNGYMEDLQQEGAQGIAVNVRRCKPAKLTIFDEVGERSDRSIQPVLSSQM
jgi:hypothetical protein